MQTSGIACRENANPYPSRGLTLESEDAAAGFQKNLWIPCRTGQASFVLGARIGNSWELKAFWPTFPPQSPKGKETAWRRTILTLPSFSAAKPVRA